MHKNSVFLSLVLFAVIGINNSYAGMIVLANDEWTLSETGYSHTVSDPGVFATNVAGWFTGGSAGNFLAYSSNFGLTGSSLAFRTMGDNNFSGSRVLAIYGSHDFERILFKRSGIPLVKDIPLSLSIHGGMFWTDFDNIPVHPGDVYYREAKTPYSETGFGIGRLLPFGLELDFTWQISAYNTNKFSFNIAGGFFDQ